MLERIQIPEVISKIVKAKCDCGNREWIEFAVQIESIIAGGLILGWSFKMVLECTKCKLVIHSDIGNFDDNINEIDLDSIFCRKNEKMMKRFEELNLKEKILNTYERLADSYKSSGISWPKRIIEGE